MIRELIDAANDWRRDFEALYGRTMFVVISVIVAGCCVLVGLFFVS